MFFYWIRRILRFMEFCIERVVEFVEAQRKMQCALQRDPSKILVAADREEGSLSRSSVRRRNPGNSSQERETSPVREEDGCACLTFVTIGPDGIWRLMAWPIRCRYHANLALLQQINALRSTSEANVQDHSGNTAVESDTTETVGVSTVSSESNELSGKSSKNSMACDNSDFLPANSTFGSSSDGSKPKKATRKNSKKKGKKKGKQNKKNSPRSNSAESEVYSEEFPNNGTSSSEGCAKNDTELSDESGSLATSQVIFMPEIKADLNDSEKSGNASCDAVEDTRIKGTSDGDICSEAFSGTQDSLIQNSVSEVRSSDDSSHAGFNETQDSNSSNNICGTGTAEGTISDVRLSSHGKKGKKVNNVPTNSGSYKLSGSGNSHARKENNHSVWQKVQKVDANICNSDEKNTDSFYPETDIVLKEIPSVINVTSLDLSSNSEDKSFTKVKASRKLKRKCGVASKQEDNSGSGKGSHVTKASSKVHTKTHTQQKRRLDIPPLVNDEITQASVSRHHPQNASPAVVLSPHKAECVTHELDVLVSKENLHPIEEVSDTASNTDVHSDKHQCNSLSNCDSGKKPNHPDAHSGVYLPHVICKEVPETGNETHEETSKENDSSASIEDKEISVGEDDSVLSSMSISDNSSVALSVESLSPRGTVEEDVTLSRVPSKSAGLTCTNPISASTYTQINQKASVSYTLETNWKMIEQAVTDVLRFRAVSEAVQKATGGSIAEIERFIHSASPVICQSHNLKTRRTSSPDQVLGDSMCRQEMPNISLGSLWKWYEKHGSYGLEVMADDFKDLKRVGSERYAFRAYFVPYLSAVQLFGSPNTDCTSQKERAKSATASEVNEYDLLFEYFESEQPQRRRPFYDKIKELMKSVDAPWKMCGDVSILTSIDMKNLHPRSWYAVAWYPIYRIPDDSFRASFLTYHSLGHFSHRDTNSSSANASLVSPVVGLLSYNAQKECWLKPRHPEIKQTVGTHSINPADILKDRLTSLLHTASLMSRASVYKANVATRNRHSDFEFFISRLH